MDVNIKDWYKNWFGNEYLTIYAHRDDEEANQLIELIHTYLKISPRINILDLCCGQGRHALQLAQSGYKVYGMDLSRQLLQVAKFRKTEDQNAYFVQADMRYLPTYQAFDLLLNLFTSFGYFESDVENISVFHQFFHALKKGGNFVFDYFNTRHVIENLVPFEKDQVGDLKIEIKRCIKGSRVQKRIYIKNKNHSAVFYESVKMYTRNEILNMLQEVGLRVHYIFGNYDGSKFSLNSPRLIIMGQKT